MILINRIMDIPLPTPFSVMFSPIHISNAEPHVIVATATIMNDAYSNVLILPVAPKSPLFPRLIAVAVPSISASAIVRYLVISVIFFLPSSPSFCISSSFGMAIVSSCIIMEDVIYGVIFNANNDICSKEPPVNASKKPNAPFLNCSVTDAMDSAVVPGRGS